jgi:PAS domain S-box-containing protein
MRAAFRTAAMGTTSRYPRLHGGRVLYGSLRVLLIDDNDDDRSLIIYELRKQFSNLTYEHICDLTAWSNALERGAFDVVIMESQLHWITGLNILQDLKAQYPDCPVIMLTRHGREELAVTAMKAGLDDFLLKTPQHYARLAAVMQSVLAHAAERRQGREAEVRYRTLFACVPVGLFRSNPEGQILDANPAFLRMYGYSDRETLVAVNLAAIYVRVEDRQRWQSLMEQEGMVRDFEVQLRRRDGTVLWGRVNSYVMRSAHQQATYYEGIVEDITARKEIEEARRLLDAAARTLDQLSPDPALPRSVVATAEVDSLQPDPVTLAIDPSSPGSRGQPVDLLQHVRPKGFMQQQLNVRIDPALAERLRLFCAERRFKVLDIVTVALERLLERVETGQLSR